MPEVQSYKHHARIDPPFHYFVLPILLLDFFFSIYATIHYWPLHRGLFLWWIVMAFALIVLAGRSRGAALKAQDRIIRLEERLRLANLIPGPELHGTEALTEAQLIALRFAADAELPTLVRRTLAESLTPRQIKEAISTWRPDNFRV